MYHWLAEFYQRCVEINPECNSYWQLASEGATPLELAEVERKLGVVLSPSHHAFLERWNGMSILDSEILGTADILQGLEDAPFEMYNGKINRYTQNLVAPENLAGTYLYYGRMPAYQFICRSFEATGIVYCLDTQAVSNCEYAICKYDPEYDFEHHCTVKFPSFEAMLLADVITFAMDEAVEMICDSPLEFTDDDEDKLVREFEAWAIAKQSELEHRGAIFHSVSRVDWSNWQ